MANLREKLKEGLTTIKIVDVCENLDNKRLPVEKNKREKGDIPYYGATGVVDYVKDYIFNEELLLVGEDGADWSPYAKTAFLINGRSWVNNHAHVLKCKKINPVFLKELLNFLDLRVYTNGTTRGKLNKEALMNIKISVPNIEVQNQIAQILSKVDEDIEATDEIIKKTKKLKAGLMQELLTRGIGHKKFKKTKLGMIPSEWEIVGFDEVVSIANGQVNPTINPYKSTILVAPNHLESDTGRIIKKETAESQRAISGKYLVKKGDVIYSKIRPYLKKVAVAEEDCLCSADMYPMKGTDKLHNSFLFYSLLSVRFTNFVNDISARTGIPKVNREELGFYKFGLPPISEQVEISNILSKIDEKVGIYEKIKSRLEILKVGLMQDLFAPN